MGAGQIGGIATLLDIDFDNTAGFLGVKAQPTEGQFIVYYLSHALMFCVGALLEAHVVLTPASCIFGERYKFDVFAGTHKFLESTGVARQVQHLCIHRGYNHTNRWTGCSPDNIALMVLNKQFSFHQREQGTDFIINRVRYGIAEQKNVESRIGDATCKYYGWGSRRNGYLIPMLIHLRRMEVAIMSPDECHTIWDYEDKFLCIQQPQCKTEKFGALCPDDVGSLIVCSGFAQGMMTSRLVDRPCGVGFIDLTAYNKFLTCGVDDSRDVVDHEDDMAFDFTTPPTPTLMTAETTARTKDLDEETTHDVNKEVKNEEELNEDLSN